MSSVRAGIGIAGLTLGLAMAGLVAAQEVNKTAPPAGPAPASPAAPAVTTIPTTPAAKALADAVTPDEGAPIPKAEVNAKPVIKAEEILPDKAPAEPTKRPRANAAVLQAVDKITAETLRFEVKVGEPVRFKGLILTVRSCETTTPDEAAPDHVAYLEVQSQPMANAGHAAAPPRQVFRGWTFANAPGLHPFEHPIYDVWLIACKTSTPVAQPPVAPKPAPAPKASIAVKSPAPSKATAKRPL